MLNKRGVGAADSPAGAEGKLGAEKPVRAAHDASVIAEDFAEALYIPAVSDEALTPARSSHCAISRKSASVRRLADSSGIS